MKLNIFKNKKLIMVAFLLLQLFITPLAYSSNVGEVSIECQKTIDAIKNNMKDTEEDVNRELNTGGATDILKCAATKIGKTRLDAVFINLLGDGGKVPYAMVRSVITNENFNDVKSDLDIVDGSTYSTENLANLIISFNYLVNQILIVLASLFFVYYLLNTTHDGSLFGEKYNAFWKVMRFVFVIVLMAPVDALNNFSIMQGVVFAIIAIAIYAGTFVWYSLLFTEAVFAIDFESVKNSERPQVYNTVVNNIDNNIMLHICDIQNRKETVLSGYSISDMKKENIDSNKFNQCLNTNVSNFNNRLIGLEGQSKTFKPSNLKTTEECSQDSFLNVKKDLSCGHVSLRIGTSGGFTMDNYIKDDYMEENLGDAFQDKIRDVAESVIALNCMQNSAGYFSNKGDYFPKCAIYKNDFKYDLEGNVITYPESNLNYTSNGVENEIKLLRNELFDSLSSVANEKMMENATADLVERIGGLIDGGFLGSVGYISENGKKYSSAKESYRTVFNSYQVGLSNNLSSSLGEDSSKSATENALSSYGMSDALFIIGDRKEEAASWVKKMFDSLFIGIQTVRSFNNVSEDKATRETESDCLDDFNSCSVVALNPLSEMVKKGINITETIQGMSLLFVAIEFGSAHLLNKIDESNAKTYSVGDVYSKIPKLPVVIINAVSGFIAGVLMFQLLIGYLMIYAIPLIIFIFFIGVVISWVISAFEAIVIINFWLILHLLPTREEGFAGQAKRGYNLLLSILVKPSFIVIGLFVAFVMISIMVAFLNVTFGIVIETFAIFNSPDSYIALAYNVTIDVLYFIALFYICFRASKSIYKVPRSLISWVGLDEDTANGAFTNIFNEYKGMIMMNMKRYLIII